MQRTPPSPQRTNPIGLNTSSASKYAFTGTRRMAPINGNECFFWRTTGCFYGDKCRFKHKPDQKGRDRKAPALERDAVPGPGTSAEEGSCHGAGLDAVPRLVTGTEEDSGHGLRAWWHALQGECEEQAQDVPDWESALVAWCMEPAQVAPQVAPQVALLGSTEHLSISSQVVCGSLRSRFSNFSIFSQMCSGSLLGSTNCPVCPPPNVFSANPGVGAVLPFLLASAAKGGDPVFSLLDERRAQSKLPPTLSQMEIYAYYYYWWTENTLQFLKLFELCL
ncbi:uncharacterized protein LOC116361870 [Oncorhynchus kisutch]|uniref:uncharacterized protein LOC116361870 n=1 Tax=Oncorhynchus kisutch TaxID=8019 RepID=UPI0012DF4E1C|nr:uncharacterized protein LOC116361870 [Oncorhynchus kisutch]